MIRQWTTMAALGAVVLASGCATITKGTQQTVTVDTDPSGAVCTMSRDGAVVAVVNPTPGSVPVGKGAGAISVICKKASYQDAAGTLASEFQAMTFGNILLGGLIGVAVDAASGAMHEYPSMVKITLIPEEFADAAQRDAFFDRMKAQLRMEVAEVKERTQKVCRPEACANELAAVDAGMNSQLADIERRRLQAKVRRS